MNHSFYKQNKENKGLGCFVKQLLKNTFLILFVTIILATYFPKVVSAQDAYAPHSVTAAEGGFKAPSLASLAAAAEAAATNAASSALKETLNGFTGALLEEAANLVISGVSRLLWISGTLLEYTVKITIVNMATIMNGTTAVPGLGEPINQAWTLFRDVSNLFFIFIILYLAFQLILGVGSGHWRSLGSLIVMAVLINFSLFFTKVVIDASNVLSVIFYAPIENAGEGGVSQLFMKQVNLQSIWNVTAPEEIGKLFGAVAGKGMATAILMIGGSLFIIITSFIFFAISLLLMVRFLYLMLLMILSPLAFACLVLPGLKGYFNKWWSTLIHQAFFAPVMFLLILMSFKILGGINRTTSLVVPPADGIVGLGSFAHVLAFNAGASVGIVFNFALAIFFMVYSLILAQKLGATGAATTINWGKSWSRSASSALGRNTLGRGARFIKESEVAKSIARSAPGVGQMMYSGLNKVSGYGFGGGKNKTLESVEKKRVEQRSKFIEQTVATPKEAVGRKTNLGIESRPSILPESKLSKEDQDKLKTERDLSKTAELKLEETRNERTQINNGYLLGVPAGKSVEAYKAELEQREKSFAELLTESKKKQADLVNKGKSLITPDEHRDEKLQNLTQRLGNKFGKNNREIWKKALEAAEKEMKKKAERSKSKDKNKTGGPGGGGALDLDDDDVKDFKEALKKEMREEAEEGKT